MINCKHRIQTKNRFTCDLINKESNSKTEWSQDFPCSDCIQTWINDQPPEQITLFLSDVIDQYNLFQPAFPSIITQAITFGQSLLKYKLAGSPNVLEDVFQKRIDLCESCEFLEKESRRCFKCGCPVEEKALWATESCPIGKWQQEIGGDIETTTTQQDMGKQGCGCG